MRNRGQGLNLGLELANLAYGNRVWVTVFGLLRLVRGFRPFSFRFFSYGETSNGGPSRNLSKGVCTMSDMRAGGGEEPQQRCPSHSLHAPPSGGSTCGHRPGCQRSGGIGCYLKAASELLVVTQHGVAPYGYSISELRPPG